MALFLPHNLCWFAFVKLALTGVGLCVLVACSRMKLFRRIPGEAVAVRRARSSICALVSYELRMLELCARSTLVEAASAARVRLTR